MSDIYGLTTTGFIRKRLNDLQQELIDAYRVAFGDIITEPDSVFGQIIGIQAKVLADVWETSEMIYFSQYADTAEGIALDYAASLAGITRKSSTRTAVSPQILIAPTATVVIPIGFQAEEPDNSVQFETIEEQILSYVNTSQFSISIPSNVSIGQVFVVTIAGNSFSYTSISGDTKESVLLQIVTLINDITKWIDLTQLFEAEQDVELVNIFALQTVQGYSCAVSATLEIVELWSHLDMVARTYGAVPAIAGTITRIVTPISGAEQINNLYAGFTGVAKESDNLFRLRFFSTLRGAGKSTIEGIRSQILSKVADATFCTIRENVGDSEDINGLPAHSFETVVAGGIAQDIADTLWLCKPAGINTYGNITKQVADSSNDIHNISFSRPIVVYVWFRISIYLYTEEILPANYNEVIKDAILSLINLQEMGSDLLIQKYIGSCYASKGIERVTMQWNISDDPTIEPSTWTDENIPISANNLVSSDVGKISII